MTTDPVDQFLDGVEGHTARPVSLGVSAVTPSVDISKRPLEDDLRAIDEAAGAWHSPRPIANPAFAIDSDLTRAVIELECARASLGEGTTPPTVREQLRSLFQLLTSIMSARIEGNCTSILDAIAGVAREMRDRDDRADEGVAEILNIQRAAEFIDDRVLASPITNLFVRELHRLAVTGLSREGDRTPGAYRLGEVTIGQSTHRPPWPADVYPKDLIRQILRGGAARNEILGAIVIAEPFDVSPRG